LKNKWNKEKIEIDDLALFASKLSAEII